MEVKRLQYIDLLRFFACVLITNSHLKGVYPLDISFGGCPGNCLFFLISGFLLSGTDFKGLKFYKWYFPKIIRLYISLWIVALISLPIKYYRIRPSLFLFPIEQFWFIPTIIILYAVYYFVMKHFCKYKYLFIGLDILIYIKLYIYVFNTNEFFVERHIVYLILYGFIAMILGSGLRELMQNKSRGVHSLYLLIVLTGGCLGLFLVMKLWIATSSVLALKLQFLTQAFSMLFACFALMSCKSIEQKIDVFMRKTALGKIVTHISVSTLEIYLIQYMIISYCKPLAFPINIILISILLIMCGVTVNRFSTFLFQKLIRI